MHQGIYINKEKIEDLKNRASLLDVARLHVDLKPQGSTFVADCPCCGGKKKLSVTGPNSKFPNGIFKCFNSSCEKTGLDGLAFLTIIVGMEFKTAVTKLADQYNFSLADDFEEVKKRAKNNRADKFRDAHLRASGIPEKYQKHKLNVEGERATSTEHDRYQSATINQFGDIVPGDDMVLHYVGLDWAPIVFQPINADGKPHGKPRALRRVRWQNPDLHQDKEGRAAKYHSPRGSGSHLWLPNALIKAYQKKEIIETLYICEGEKKADKMSLHGMMSVGIMGISNFSNTGEMPHQFEQIIKTCAVANVVFVLDSDWQDISLNSKNIENRPRTFCNAVTRFRKYFYAFAASGFSLKIYLAAGRDKVLKGADDLLVHQFLGKEDELKGDIEAAMIDRDGKGKHLDVIDITSAGDYKLSELWSLHNKNTFLIQHLEVLKKIGEFSYSNMKHRWNEELVQFELVEKILPAEKFFEVVVDRKGGKNVEIKYERMLRFLENRGFRCQRIQKADYRITRTIDGIIREIDATELRRYVREYLKAEGADEAVIDAIIRGGAYFFGADKLEQLPYLDADLLKSDRDTHYMVFENCFWKINADGITEHPLNELSKNVWENKCIAFAPKYLGSPLIEFKRDGENWTVGNIQKEGIRKCEMYQFYKKTSEFHWKKSQFLAENEDGSKTWERRDQPSESPSTADSELQIHHVVCKMLAAGYVLHDNFDKSQMKAIICMDSSESEVGRSQGGTGKSIWGSAFQYCIPTFFADGKDPRLTKDPHYFSRVDERTQLLLFDDLEPSFKFNPFYSKITMGLTVNPKGKTDVFVGLKRWIFNTNHALSGRDTSDLRRQYFLAFCDYYNLQRTPKDDFGHQLFDDWGHEQWNLFYNFMATCVMHFLRHGLKYTIPSGNLERRKLRQDVGENMVQWCELVFDPEDDESYLNKKCAKDWLIEQYFKQYPKDRQWMGAREFKDRLALYASYAKLLFNPGANQSGRIKSGATEYLVIGNEQYSKDNARILPGDGPF
jgi:hypothetical protein